MVYVYNVYGKNNDYAGQAKTLLSYKVDQNQSTCNYSYLVKYRSDSSLMGHVNQNPIKHYFGHTQSMIAYKILTKYFRKFQ